ncbi:unnamed protein product, partial [Amoebophrya sp. A120]|eukprot:GSA120T00016285001.1
MPAQFLPLNFAAGQNFSMRFDYESEEILLGTMNRKGDNYLPDVANHPVPAGGFDENVVLEKKVSKGELLAVNKYSVP